MNGEVSFSGLTSPQAVKAAIDECRQHGRQAFLDLYGFRKANTYSLLFDDGVFDSKAIAAVAFGYQYGIEALRPEQCAGGKGHGQAGWALDRLGFDVTGIEHKGWYLHEVELAVEAYFNMMVLQAAGAKFRKSDILKKLVEQNPTRSIKAFEYKLQNISAVLRDLNRPRLEGYAPMGSYQALLRYVVEDRLGVSGGEPPKVLPSTRVRVSKTDWADRDARNRALGEAGERFVYDLERTSLIDGGRADLAEKVQWVSQEGDGHGYDIVSFDKDGNPKHIEVKTTSGNEDVAFFVSENEMRTSARLAASFWLYRVFNFPHKAQVARHLGPIEKAFSTAPSVYRASPR